MERPGTESRLLPPGHRTDPFCSCPSCDLVATHAIREGKINDQKLVNLIGDTFWLEQRLVGRQFVERRCVFCGYDWILID